MHGFSKVSVGMTFFTLAAVVGCAVIPLGRVPADSVVAMQKPDFSAAGIDPMPVGTARQVSRMKHARAVRKV